MSAPRTGPPSSAKSCSLASPIPAPPPVTIAVFPVMRMRGLLRSVGAAPPTHVVGLTRHEADRKSTRLNSSHSQISYAVFCLKKKKKTQNHQWDCRSVSNFSVLFLFYTHVLSLLL